MNYNFLFYSTVICTAFFLVYCLYYLIKNNYLSKKISTTTNNSSNIRIETNNKNIVYRKITKFSLIPSSGVNGDLSPDSIYEAKFNEICTVYSQELVEFRVTEVEVWDTITSFEAAALYAPDVNEIIITILSYIHT